MLAGSNNMESHSQQRRHSLSAHAMNTFGLWHDNVALKSHRHLRSWDTVNQICPASPVQRRIVIEDKHSSHEGIYLMPKAELIKCGEQ
ncbi:hypothetical protein JOB18_020846 [Solea senegalensis]|uniref:Uncharacterized protein n=1 Tax=Solea senegalensis TaxID=28829 RepID=A0AAV6SLH6_SOLSE|nr:hypothetical protein JOB18_020846 [Solea senegalensis]